MNRLIKKIEGNANLFSSVQNCETQVTPILQGFITNFPEYTDHSINHSKTVLGYAAHLLSTELDKLNEDEVYILIMAGFLHDIGMCPTNEMKEQIKESSTFKESGKSFEDHLRDIHHKLSYQYITTFWKELKIVNETYAEAIGLVGMGHRKVELLDFNKYNPEFVVKSGSDFVCLPYLAGVLRLADELDITNDRTPELLYNEYFPTNKISKEEWEKHKANYFVSFNKPTIKITSKCFEKDLYYALLKQYNKIDGVIKYVQKIVNTIPQNERRLKVEYLKLEKDVKTIGFIPKEIGFTFDLQNTINTFIGDNIYQNKFVAIRECLQNAIDTCRYKKQISKSSYSPEINITLKDGKLIVSDNGLGMDEFIVENYFSKLAKSYYTETRVSKEFEAISQFGIGVFSYFLLCDYFEVESKQEGKPSIKFRATKNAENYFHFYDNVEKPEIGSTITFFLSKDISFDDLLDQVKHYIRFFEYPISIEYENRQEHIVSNNFELNRFELLGKRIDREYYEVLQDLELIDAPLNNDLCEGNLGLLFSKDDTGTYLPIHDYDTFKTYHSSNIELSQKGIFVGSIDHTDVRNVIGKINLKRKNEIDIGRYHIKNSKQLSVITQQFIEDIFTKVFKNWESKSPIKKERLTTDLIRFYFSDYQSNNVSLLEKFYNEVFFSVFTGSKIEYLSLSKILEFEEIVIVHEDTPFSHNSLYNYHNVNEIYSQLKKPLLLQNRGKVAGFLLDIFKSKKHHIEIISSDKHWFYYIKTKVTSTSDYKFFSQKYEGYTFDKPHICAYTNLYVERVFNKQHEILGHISINEEKISKDQRQFKVIEEFLHEMSQFVFKFHSSTSKLKDPSSEIKFLSSILDKLNKSQGTHFILSEKDFPSWINEQINWKNVSTQ